MGLPLRWVSSPSASSAGASLSWAPAVLGLVHVEVVSARLNPSHGTIGEGNGTPLQYSCLENPMDGGTWWATVHVVTKSLHSRHKGIILVEVRLSSVKMSMMLLFFCLRPWDFPGKSAGVGCHYLLR